MYARLMITLVVFTLSFPMSASAEGTVTEPSSNITFKVKSDDGLVLLGVGIRKFLFIKGYATAMYVDPVGFKKAVKDRSTDGLGKAIQYGTYKRRILLHFLRNVRGKKVQEVFRAALKKAMTPEDFEAQQGEIDKFLEGCMDLKKNDVFSMYSDGGKTKILHGKRVVYEGRNAVFNRGMWGGYFGPDPVSEELRESMVKRAPLVLDGE